MMESLPETVQVSAIHFLIHPGYLSDYEDKNDENREPKAKFNPLIQKYFEHLRGIPEDEIVFLISHLVSDELDQAIDEEKPWAKLVFDLEDLLGDRLIVVTDDFDGISAQDPFNMPAIFGRAQEIARAKGFQWDKNIATFAYGERISECVDSFADCFNIEGGFNRPTQVKLEFTDLNLRTDAIADHTRSLVQKLFSRLEYS